MAAEEVVDVGNEEQVQTRKNKSKSKRDREVTELRDILSNYGGRAYLWRLMSRCGVFETSFTGDVNMTIFREGKRDTGLKILLEIMEVDTSAFQKMQIEAVERDKK